MCKSGVVSLLPCSDRAGRPRHAVLPAMPPCPTPRPPLRGQRRARTTPCSSPAPSLSLLPVPLLTKTLTLGLSELLSPPPPPSRLPSSPSTGARPEATGISASPCFSSLPKGLTRGSRNQRRRPRPPRLRPPSCGHDCRCPGPPPTTRRQSRVPGEPAHL